MKKDRFIPRSVSLVLEPAPGQVLAKQVEAIAELFKSYTKGGVENATDSSAQLESEGADKPA